MSLYKSADLDWVPQPPSFSEPNASPWGHVHFNDDYWSIMGTTSGVFVAFPGTNDVRIWELMLSSPNNLMMMTGKCR